MLSIPRKMYSSEKIFKYKHLKDKHNILSKRLLLDRLIISKEKGTLMCEINVKGI